MKTIKEKIIEILCVQDLQENKTYEQQADEILSLFDDDKAKYNNLNNKK